MDTKSSGPLGVRLGGVLLYIALKNEITSIESLELKIATKSNKIKRHLEKWDKVITLFSM